jgi:hypothetical protein
MLGDCFPLLGGMGNSLLAFTVKVNAAHLPLHLVEADVVEALEASPIDGPNPVVGDEKVLLPAHEDVFPLVNVLDVRLPALARLLMILPECGELGPVGEIDLLVCAPALVLGDEAVL